MSPHNRQTTVISWIYVLCTVGALTVSAGCGDRASSGTGATCPTDSTLTYASFGQTFMATYCVKCHSESLTGVERAGAPDEYNFDTLQLVSQHLEAIDAAAAAGPNGANTSMPPEEPRPSLAQRRQLGEWLACGGR